MLTNDIDILAAGGRRGASAGFLPLVACGGSATFASHCRSRVAPDGMNPHDRPIGPRTMR